jgi:hypothetical protein
MLPNAGGILSFRPKWALTVFKKSQKTLSSDSRGAYEVVDYI